MTIIPCEQNKKLSNMIEIYSKELKLHAHTLGSHGLTEDEFYNSGLFRGAIERIRGQFSAEMKSKREFARHILNYMEEMKYISGWTSSGESNRHDYTIELVNGKIAVIELKGCLDGNNTNIFERPANANEFVIWGVCTNSGSDPRKNAWSGIHTRLSAEIIERSQVVDGLIIWDMVCGTVGRPCPKLSYDPELVTTVGPYRLPPPCIYVFPSTVPSPRNNPNPSAQSLSDVSILQAFSSCFKGLADEISYVDFQIEHKGAETLRKTVVRRAGRVVKGSKPTPIRRR